MSRRLVSIAVVGASLPFFLLPPAASAAVERRLPSGFFGVVPETSVSAGDLDQMRGEVETVRLPVVWAAVEPSSGEYEFASLDEIVLAAAERGIRVFPFVYGTPAWIAKDPMRPPLGSAMARRAWSAFLWRLVHRYGPAGSIWNGQSSREPIRAWQIWNEPNFRLFWHPHTSPAAYARLLAISAPAIRAADSRAEIVLAGVAPVGAGPLPWVFLRRLYRVPGVRRSFDAVAVHPYSATVKGMSEQIEAAREVMAEAGDGDTRLFVTELGVASWGSAPSGFIKGRRGQAEFLRRAFRRLLEMRRRWHLAGVDWFTWRDQSRFDPHCAFCQGAGLLDVDGKPKPAWWAFRQAIEETRVR
jgi:hypothetical protein